MIKLANKISDETIEYVGILAKLELSEEEKRGRKHKNKVVLEAERQAKVALDKVEKYAVFATIDKKELTIPLLNINAYITKTYQRQFFLACQNLFI